MLNSKLVVMSILLCDDGEMTMNNEKWTPSRMLFVKIADNKLQNLVWVALCIVMQLYTNLC